MSPSSAVTALTFSPCGSFLAFLTSTSDLRIWTGTTLLPPLSLPPSSHLSCGPTVLAVASSTAPLVRFVHPHLPSLLPLHASARTDAVVIALSPPLARLPPSAPGAPPGGRFAVHSRGVVRVLTYAGASVASLPLPGPVVFSAAFSADGDALLLGDTAGHVRLWRIRPHETAAPLLARAHAGFVSALAFSPAADAFASAGWDGVACVWSAEGGRLRRVASVVAEAPHKRKRGKAHAVALGADGVLATGGAEGVVRVWRIAEGGQGAKEPVAVHDAHHKAVYKLAIAPDGKHVASGSADGTVRVLGIPGRPVLVSRREGGEGMGHEDENADGTFEIRPVDVVVKGQRADRRLIFCPSNVVTLACPICTNAYDGEMRKPICSGACGHTFACSVCNDTMWETDRSPCCPECRTPLVDVVPNYELLRVLAAATSGGASTPGGARATAGGTRDARDEFGQDYIELKRLSWTEIPELAYMRRHNCVVYTGTMDGESVAIRLPLAGTEGALVDASERRLNASQQHIRCLKRLRGPHMVQLYGLSRTQGADKRTVVVTEVPSGGTLGANLSLVRRRKQRLTGATVLALSLQIVRATRFLHESDTSGGWALSGDAIGLALPLREDWAARQRIKLFEVGGTVCKAECGADVRREFPADYVGYMAPELLDEDRDTGVGKEETFRRLCMADMYSVGVLLWEMASGNRPFEGLRPAQVVAAVIGRGERPGFPPEGVAEEVQDLISRLWVKDPEARPTAVEACQLLETVPSAPPMF